MIPGKIKGGGPSYGSHIPGLILIAVFLMLALNSWNAKSCFNPDELFYYKSSQTLVHPENIFAPKYYGEPRFQKPPLFYAAIFFAMKLFGVNWFSARLITILSSIAVLIVTYMLGLKMLDKKKALFAAVILATSVLFFRFGRIALPEMSFVLCITGAFYFAYRYFTENTACCFYIAFLVMGIGMLIKGPIALLLPAGAIFIFQRAYRERGPLPFTCWVYGICIALGLSLLWFIPTLILHGGCFIDHIMKNEVSARLIGDADSATSSGTILYYLGKALFYIPTVFAEFLPWSVAGPAALVLNREKLETKKFTTGRAFLLIWIVTGFLIFTIVPAKRAHYVLSFLPAMSLYLASFFDFGQRRVKDVFIAIASAAACAYLFAILAVFPLILNDGVDRLSMKLRDVVKASDAQVGVSWRLDPQKVELYIDRRTHIMPDHEFTKKEFPKLNVSYILTADEEYNKYLLPMMVSEKEISPGLPAITIIAEDRRWRKRIPFSKCIFDIIRDPNNAGAYLKDTFQEKVYLMKVTR